MNKKSKVKKDEKVLSKNKFYRISIVTNFVVEPYLLPFIKLNFSKSDISANVRIIQMDNFTSEIEKINNDLIVVLLNFECQYTNWYNDVLSRKITSKQLKSYVIEKCRAIYQALKTTTSCPIVWFGYENEDFYLTNICGATSEITNTVNNINLDIIDFLNENDSYIDMRHLIADIGISNSYDSKGKYRWNAPYSRQLMQSISNEIYKQYQIQKGITKKCIVIDCDGVLWGGVLSEDGIEKIELGNEGIGRIYQDFQRILLTLYYHGVILAVCSKNDLQDVLHVFHEHSGMILKSEHIACFQVNWDNKTDNICKIADMLNIGLDSIVFVDDSEFEVKAVRKLLPEVLSIQYEKNSINKLLMYFNLKSRVNIEQVKKRNLTYQTNHQRKNLSMACTDYDSYLKSLDIKVEIHKAITSEIARIAELTQRTNRCTNGTRYTTSEISTRIESQSYHLYSVYMSDKFSDLGLVGIIGIDGSTLDLFSLSCRALGLNIEDKMMKVAFDENVTGFKFVSTRKNEVLQQQLQKYFSIY